MVRLEAAGGEKTGLKPLNQQQETTAGVQHMAAACCLFLSQTLKSVMVLVGGGFLTQTIPASETVPQCETAEHAASGVFVGKPNPKPNMHARDSIRKGLNFSPLMGPCVG